MKLNMLDLNKLHVFAAVAERGSVSGAAAALGRTPSAVSQSVSGFEAALGVRLFDRVGKRLVLTRGGQRLYAHVHESQAALQRAIDEVADVGGPASGLVRIGVYLGFPRLRLAAFLARFAAEHPQVQLRVVYAPQEDLDARLLRNRLDVAFALRPRNEASPRLASTRLFEERLELVGGRRYFRRGFRLDELSRTPVIDYYQSDPLIRRWLAHHFGDAAPAAARVTIWAATTDLVLDLVLAHAGVGVLPHDVAAPHLRLRRLTALGTRRPPLRDFIWLNEPRGAYRDRTLERFRAAVLRELGGAEAPSGPRRPR